MKTQSLMTEVDVSSLEEVNGGSLTLLAILIIGRKQIGEFVEEVATPIFEGYYSSR